MPKHSDVGKYQRVKLLGSGHFGAVYEVFDRALQARRAMKVISVKDPNALIDKLTEARILEICKHKHVVNVNEADIRRIDGKDCVIITTELLSGGSAEEKINSTFLSVGETIKIVRDTLFGLEHLHVSHVAHGDIKPGNILLTASGTAKLSDFGLSIRLKMGDVSQNTYTLHTAPENVGGKPQANTSSDIYSMGVTLYRLLNNIQDFRSTAPTKPLAAIMKGKFPDRTAYRLYVPAKLKRICNKAMNIDLSRRYVSATKFGQSLDILNVEIDWKPLSPVEWVGSTNDATHRAVAASNRNGWFVDYLRNGRKVAKYCRRNIANNWEAEAELESIVAKTSICR